MLENTAFQIVIYGPVDHHQGVCKKCRIQAPPSPTKPKFVSHQDPQVTIVRGEIWEALTLE